MKRTPILQLLVFTALFWAILPAVAAIPGKNGPAMTTRPMAPHIAAISRDTIMVVKGSTYAFTVDTPEKEGLVSTGTTVEQLLEEVTTADGAALQYKVLQASGAIKTTGTLEKGDRLIVTAPNGESATYHLVVAQKALTGQLQLLQPEVTINAKKDITLHYTAGQRSPDATVQFHIPAGISVTPENTTVNIIGRGAVKLKDLPAQSIGRTGTHYSDSKVGDAVISPDKNGGCTLTFRHLDLRPANVPDLVLVIHDAVLPKTSGYPFKAIYTTAQPAILTSSGNGTEAATLRGIRTIADLTRVLEPEKHYQELANTYTSVNFRWTAGPRNTGLQLMQSADSGRSWAPATATINTAKGSAAITGLHTNQLYQFRLAIKDGDNKGFSNTVSHYTGKLDIKHFGVTGEDGLDNTDAINHAISYLHHIGGGTLLFSKGVYNVRTIHLQSNVFLYVDKDAVIKALPGADAPETTWFSDKAYRSGLSPTDPGPYLDPENYMTKQDVGHHYFRNCMFFGERLDNVKIIGNGLITGNGNLGTSDKIMNNTPDKRADKMFVLKLCTNLEIGGLAREEDLWYDEEKDAPYYIGKDGTKISDNSNMLQIDRAGHFVLLATGTDNIFVHNTCLGKNNQTNARDIYDFMACNNVTATNIYSKVSSDDIIKPGSDCSLGFTRPARHYRVRNIIGDTNCNLFQVGSETVDDIMDICVDNIYILGANKAGFSISTNDGAHVKDIHLNCGHTGPVRLRSKMFRTTAPFFISISNRGRVIGADVGKYTFTENGRQRTELLVKNVNIGQVENIIINGIDIAEVYSGSSYGGRPRWKAFDGSQKRATSIIAGYRLPESSAVEGGLDFKLPNGQHTGYIRNISFTDVHIVDEGGNPISDTANDPPELGVGQYNVANLKVQPSYGIWARHVKGLTVKQSSFNYEKHDNRYALYLDDVIGGTISGIKTANPADTGKVIKLKGATGINVKNITQD